MSAMSYWAKTGRYQNMYDTICPLLVPAQGAAATDHGETLRVVSEIYKDFHSNGSRTVFDLVDHGLAHALTTRPADGSPWVLIDFFDMLQDDYHKARHGATRLDKGMVEELLDYAICHAKRMMETLSRYADE